MTERWVVVCQRLTTGYDEEPVLRDIDFRVRPGEIVAVLGGSGSGKSTLLRSMVGLLPPLGGTVELFGENLYEIEPGRRELLLRRTGMLFQHDALFGSMTLLENLLLPLEELTRLPASLALELARAKLSLVELSELEDRRPDEISGGQRKRAALARACLLDPEILFCDEPTAGLDPPIAAQIDRTLKRFQEVLGIAIVIITHDVESVKSIANRAVVLSDGVICAEGAAVELEHSSEPTVRRFFHRGLAEDQERPYG